MFIMGVVWRWDIFHIVVGLHFIGRYMVMYDLMMLQSWTCGDVCECESASPRLEGGG